MRLTVAIVDLGIASRIDVVADAPAERSMVAVAKRVRPGDTGSGQPEVKLLMMHVADRPVDPR